MTMHVDRDGMPSLPWFPSDSDYELEDLQVSRHRYVDPPPEADELAFAIVGAAIAVHCELGAGHSESVYERALSLELEHRNVPFETQVPAVVLYRGVVVGESRLDMVVGGLVIVELRVVERLHAQHTIQTLSYLQATKLPLALLINFNISTLTKGVRRVLPLRTS